MDNVDQYRLDGNRRAAAGIGRVCIGKRFSAEAGFVLSESLQGFRLGVGLKSNFPAKRRLRFLQ